MSGKPFDRYGAIFQEDVDVLEACLAELVKAPVVRVCEIGSHDGGTAKGIRRYVEEHGAKVEYWGIDPDTCRLPWVWDGAHLINGDSAEVFHLVPDALDMVWVDGCHCMNHVILDTVHFAPKVRNFGFICFHDVNPVGSGGEHQYHGPQIPEFGLAVNMALAAIQFPWAPWELFMEKIPPEVHNCGTRAYIKGRK